VITYDQRGCGNSKYAELLIANTTQDLVEDIEKIRKHLNINKWIMNGRSWGSTLVLAYAQQFPSAVLAIITGGICLAREFDEKFLYDFGANQIFPESYEKFIRYFEINNIKDIQRKIKDAIYQDDFEKAFLSTMEMFNYESSVSMLCPELNQTEEKFDEGEKKKIINCGKIYLHYLENNYFISENEFLLNIENLKNIPGVIIQGRYDLVCPFLNAWNLHKVWPEAEFITTLAGHNGSDPANTEKILEYTDKFAVKFSKM
jgi:proline iminopeptidase